MAHIELRSDTFTVPTPEMLQAMLQAKIGDDVFGEDESVAQLEAKTAALFGKEAGLFCPSGTMANQIAIKCHTQPMDEVICEENAHIYLYEGGGIAYHSAASVRLLKAERGILNAAQIEAAINADNVHFPKTSLVALENTSNRGGGSFYRLSQIQEIRKVCEKHQLALHLDGARVFNALVASGESALEHGKQFDSISICLSKGLGAPVGSVLIGTKAFIYKARRVRKVLGGGMRQAGFLAAAGIHALDYHVQKLSDDHRRAKELATILSKLPYVAEVIPVDTNIVIFRLIDQGDADQLLKQLEAKGLKAAGFGKQMIRLVTHFQFTDEQLNKAKEILQSI